VVGCDSLFSVTSLEMTQLTLAGIPSNFIIQILYMFFYFRSLNETSVSQIIFLIGNSKRKCYL